MPASCMIESSEQRQALLALARQTAKVALGAQVASPIDKPEIDGWFGGAFVTFWAGKTLKGCVGTFVPTTDIAGTIQEVTRASLKDRRFATDPIRAETLANLDIEISVLSGLTPTSDPGSLVPGKHGIVVRRAGQSGCFLPKVADERGWSAEEFLSACCTMKAGLPGDAWRDSDAEVLLFTAEVFSESECR